MTWHKFIITPSLIRQHQVPVELSARVAAGVQWRRAGRTGCSRYLLSAGMTFPESWLAPTSLALSRLSTERSRIPTRTSLRTDGSAIALVNNSSCLPCLERGEAVKNQHFAPCTLLTKKGMRHDKHRPRAHTNPLAHPTAVTRPGGSRCPPRTSLPSTWSFSSPVCQTLGAAVVSRQSSSSHSEHAPLLHPPSLIRVIAMEICYSNTEILELPSGEEDLKGPQCDGWSLLYFSAPKGQALSLADTGCSHPHKRVLGNFCVCCCYSQRDCAEIQSSHPLL